MGLFSLDLTTIMVTLIVLFTSMPVHECAHAWMAYWRGDDTAAAQGRLNLSPFRHLDLIGSLMLLLTQRFGWAKPVPVNPRRFDRKISMRAGMALTSLAGPMANLLLALAVMLISKLLAVVLTATGMLPTSTREPMFILFVILSTMVSINISLAVFNLLPIPPLDGYNILAYFIPAKWEYKIAQYQQFIFLGLLAIMMFTDLFSVPLIYLSNWVYDFLNFITGFVDVIAEMLI